MSELDNSGFIDAYFNRKTVNTDKDEVIVSKWLSEWLIYLCWATKPEVHSDKPYWVNWIRSFPNPISSESTVHVYQLEDYYTGAKIEVETIHKFKTKLVYANYREGGHGKLAEEQEFLI